MDSALKPGPRVGVVVLAAGRSSRMGTSKLDLPLPSPGREEARLGEYAVRAALESNVGDVWVVVPPGETPEWLERSRASRGGEVAAAEGATAGVAAAEGAPAGGGPRLIEVRAADSKLGQAHSLRAGVEAAREWVEALVILLADQPFVPAQWIEGLAATYLAQRAAGGSPLAVCAVRPDGGESGERLPVARPPLLLGPLLLDRTAGLSGDEGARRLLRDPEVARLTKTLPAPDPWIFFDVDTLQEYEHALLHAATIR